MDASDPLRGAPANGVPRSPAAGALALELAVVRRENRPPDGFLILLTLVGAGLLERREPALGRDRPLPRAPFASSARRRFLMVSRSWRCHAPRTPAGEIERPRRRTSRGCAAARRPADRARARRSAPRARRRRGEGRGRPCRTDRWARAARWRWRSSCCSAASATASSARRRVRCARDGASSSAGAIAARKARPTAASIGAARMLWRAGRPCWVRKEVHTCSPPPLWRPNVSCPQRARPGRCPGGGDRPRAETPSTWCARTPPDRRRGWPGHPRRSPSRRGRDGGPSRRCASPPSVAALPAGRRRDRIAPSCAREHGPTRPHGRGSRGAAPPPRRSRASRAARRAGPAAGRVEALGAHPAPIRRMTAAALLSRRKVERTRPSRACTSRSGSLDRDLAGPAHEPDRQGQRQLAAPRLGEQPRGQARADGVRFPLRDRAPEPQEQPAIGRAGVVRARRGPRSGSPRARRRRAADPTEPLLARRVTSVDSTSPTWPGSAQAASTSGPRRPELTGALAERVSQPQALRAARHLRRRRLPDGDGPPGATGAPA